MALWRKVRMYITNGLNAFINATQKKSVSVLEVGFGTGLNAYLSFLQTRLQPVFIHYESLEAYPVSQEDAKVLNYIHGYEATIGSLFLKMHEQEWNVTRELTPQFELTKQLITVQEFTTDKTFDLIYYDAFSPKEQPELWTETVFKKLYALLNPGGVLITYCAQGQMKRHLKSAGFTVKTLPGYGKKREMTRAEKI